MPNPELEKAIESGKEKAHKREDDVLIYVRENSPIDHEYTVTLSRWGLPNENPSIGRTFRIIAELFYEDGDIRVSFAPSVDVEKSPEEKNEELYEGRPVYVVFENGDLEKTEVTKITERQIQTDNGMKFKKSDLTAGWGTEPSELSLDVESFEREQIPDRELNDIQEGDRVVNSNKSVFEVTDVTARQIKTDGENYKKSDGEVWGGGDLKIIKKL